jgi:catechol 2,3-dioxygenase-like lactoylglutathione lyase family enzyme
MQEFLMSSPVTISSLDHIVLTVADVDATCAFYARVLGMEKIVFGSPARVALGFGRHKINLHPIVNDYDTKAIEPMPGSADYCLITETPVDEVIEHLKACEVAIIEGPIAKSGAMGPLNSVYFRDPDGNLIEVSNYV